MPQKKISAKAVWAVSAAVMLVVVLLILLFVTQKPAAKQESIVLPPAQDDTTEQTATPSDSPEHNMENQYFEVTNDNVLMALKSLNPPAAYHQTYSVTVGSDDRRAVHTVDFWSNGPYIHAEISDEQDTRSIISDGNTAYLWYQNEETYISVSLTDGLSVEDLLGLPAFDSYLMIQQADVVDSGYLVLEDPAVQCIYVCTQNERSDTSRYWVNLENGLLFQSDVLENSNQIYTIKQTAFEALAMEDESFRDRFQLPDGTRPFIAAREMPQP